MPLSANFHLASCIYLTQNLHLIPEPVLLGFTIKMLIIPLSRTVPLLSYIYFIHSLVYLVLNIWPSYSFKIQATNFVLLIVSLKEISSATFGIGKLAEMILDLARFHWPYPVSFCMTTTITQRQNWHLFSHKSLYAKTLKII